MSYDKLAEMFTSSTKLSQEGIWIDVDLGGGGPQPGFLIGRMGSTNPKWSDMASQSYRQHSQKIEGGFMSATESRQRAISVFCHTVLFDWRNIDDKDGNPILYTPEQGIHMMTKMDRLYDYLLAESQKDANFREYVIKEKLGNLKSI